MIVLKEHDLVVHKKSRKMGQVLQVINGARALVNWNLESKQEIVPLNELKKLVVRPAAGKGYVLED